ncbi:ABC transporter substrate-binding protein (plasmid) [Mesorhizobium sp. AR10]|uniref:ABC transporter substrate-binding protein n=1 Tax=Mesorhizobium sp. AR10 TaxID=2865839 RepID=UPI00216089F6|nr:ABC transporter substrate-binding protein [Mesorhizobium sp. AR10]UVK35513.1 ABC transporter substrate-binding protein [Mesorhizobium sp. AR10]
MSNRTIRHLRMAMTSIAVLAGLALQPALAAPVTVSVLYAVPANFSDVQKEIATRFMAEHPDIKIEFRTPAKDYEAGVEQILRGVLSKDLPDVAFVGLNQVRLLEGRNLIVPLDELASKDGGFQQLGYNQSIVDLGKVSANVFALPFAVSTPILYVNEDLVRAAGGDIDHFPKTWGGINDLAVKIGNLPGKPDGFFFQWDASGNWLYQALVNSHGGNLVGPNGCEARFDSDAGLWGLQTLQSFHEAGMPNLNWSQSRQAFDAGKLGIVAGSTSYVTTAAKLAQGRFRFRTMPWPDVVDGGKVPAGGTSAVILPSSAEKEQAAWEYVKFATGPIGQTLMAQYTGYMPSNEKAINDENLLKAYYDKHPELLTSVKQLQIVSPWESWAGANGLKIIDVMKTHVEAVATGRSDANATMPTMKAEVQALLPSNCATVN